MKLKQVLLGGLLFTVPFTACTNEELIDTTVPSTPEEVLSKAVSLGDDFSIVGNKGISTRAIIKDDLSGSIWEKTDTVGGAWYASTTDGGEHGTLIQGTNLFSNHPFAFSKDLGGMASVEFKANTNAFAGKYLLYYPYNYKVAAVSSDIPVEFEQNPVMDCTAGNELKHVNKNIFAWCDAEFKHGGPQAGAFELKQAGNVVVINLGSTEGNLDRIQNKKIEKIILESTDGSGAGNLYSKAKIVVDDSGTYKDYVGKYVAVSAISTYILTPENAGTDYQITAADKAGMTKKSFYLSMLPANKNTDNLTVKVIMSDGRMYQKVLAKSDNAALFAKLIKPAQKIVLDVILDEEIDAEGVYTVEQFNAEMLKAAKEIKLAADITLPSLNFNKPGKSVKITGHSLTVDGELTVADGGLTIDSKLIAKNKVTVAENGTLTVSDNGSKIGALKVDGTATINADEVASAVVTKAAQLTLKGVVKGALTIGRSADVTLDGVTLKGATNNNGGDIAVKATSSNEGTFSSIGGSITTGTTSGVVLTNKKTMTLDGVEVTGTEGVKNEAGATLSISGAAATISKLTNDAADINAKKAAGVVNVEMAAAETGSTILTVTTLTNNGTLNVKRGTLKPGTPNTTTLGGSSVTNVAKDGCLDVTGVASGTRIGTAGAKIVIAETTDLLGASNTTFATDVIVAIEITKFDGWDGLAAVNNTPITSVILNGTVDLTKEDIAKLGGKALTLKKSIKIVGDPETDSNEPDQNDKISMDRASLNVEGEVTISADAGTTLTLASGENSINGKLTIGKNVTLKGNAAGSTIKLNNGEGQLAKADNGDIDSNIALKN